MLTSCGSYISDSAILNCLAKSRIIKATKDTTDICRDIASDERLKDNTERFMDDNWYERLDLIFLKILKRLLKK